ncbi:glycosyltransferase [Pycnococcus provasolii]
MDDPRLRYHRRPKKWLHEDEDIKDAPAPPHHHAKAGNINHALMLGALRGDYMLCLDSDMVPRRDALQRVLPHFFTLGGKSGGSHARRIQVACSAAHRLRAMPPRLLQCRRLRCGGTSKQLLLRMARQGPHGSVRLRTLDEVNFITLITK